MDDQKRDAQDIDEMVEIIERLMAQGSMHVSVHTGEHTRVQTQSTRACEGGACAQPTEEPQR